jgi:Family of unknown function (DUF6365)
MKVLLVTPIEEGSGEIITAIHVGEDLRRDGHEILFLASSFARKFVEARLPGLSMELGPDGAQNLSLWCRIINEFAPDVVVFADYPFLFVPRGVAPLGNEPGWLDALGCFRGTLITLDHFGFAQRQMGLFFGPPHMTPFYYHRFDEIPESMEILLPCPMHEPHDVAGRRGQAFRYWDVPLRVRSDVRKEVRRRYLKDQNGFLIFHSVPNWAWRVAQILQVDLYRYLPELLDHYLGDLPHPVTLVSVNNGQLLDPARAPRLRIINLPPVPVSEFEALLLSSELIITENRLSISMGKALCGFQNCVALVNRQSTLDLISSSDVVVRRVVSAMESQHFASVYPFEVFPGGLQDLLEQIILYQDNSLTRAFCDIEIFGGESSSLMFRRLLLDDELRADFRSKQEYYVGNLAKLPGASEAISRFVAIRRA